MSCSYNLTTVDPVNVWLQTLCWTCSLKPCLLGHHAVCACCVTAALPCVVVTQATDEISELASAVWLNAQSQEDKDSISESKAAVVFHTPTYTCRKVDSCFPEIEKWKALHNQTFDFMQIDHLWLNLFDFDLTWFHCVCVFSLITYIMYNSVTYGERAIFFCVLLFVFPCSCTGCGVCPTLQLSAGQDTSLVQCVTLPGPGAIWYFLKGHVMDSSNVSWCSTCQHYVV